MPPIKCVDSVLGMGSGGSWEGLWDHCWVSGLGISSVCVDGSHCVFPMAQSPQGLGAGDNEFNNDAINLMLRFDTWFEVGWFMGGAVGTFIGYLG